MSTVHPQDRRGQRKDVQIASSYRDRAEMTPYSVKVRSYFRYKRRENGILGFEEYLETKVMSLPPQACGEASCTSGLTADKDR